MLLVYNTVFVTVCTASCCTEATTLLLSRQSTLDDLDGPDPIPKTSERARPRLRKMYSMDMSSSSADSGSMVSRCLTHACFVHSFTLTIVNFGTVDFASAGVFCVCFVYVDVHEYLIEAYLSCLGSYQYF